MTNLLTKVYKTPQAERYTFIVRKLEKALRGCRVLVFVDLEGTQYSHEITEIGAYKVWLNDDLSVKKIGRPFRCYSKPKHPIGSFVSKMTGITEDKLAKEGVPFNVAQNSFRKYVGADWTRCLFLTYGNQDAFMMHQSLECCPEGRVEDVKLFAHRNLDFSAFLSNYVRDSKGNNLSLIHACEAFEVPLVGQAHDALNDARDLIGLYNAFVTKKEILKSFYLKVLALGKISSPSIKKAAKQLSKGQDVTHEQFEKWIEEELA